MTSAQGRGWRLRMTCTHEQIRKLQRYAATHTLEQTAQKAGVSLSTAKRYLRGGRVKERKPHTWKTREDPFELVWPQLKTMLERDQGLEAGTLMQFLLENYPGEFSEGQVRTLRRRIREWRILEGPESTEVFFRQNLVPGRQSQSDYTHCTELGITLEGAPFPHLLYHFMLPYSRWEYVWVCHTESYETLTKGYLGATRN